jgi:hypothetical protein
VQLGPYTFAESLAQHGYISAGTLSQIANVTSEVQHIWATSDKIWIGTRLLAGMSAGFGLRVVLPLRPWEVSAVVLSGWAAAAAVGVYTEVWTL